ncbi:hypothetical protein [Delftia lacustris]|jgi:hypothetical protein|uniref:hypothetical protein n=1 Tax=Comamonadaceae TaxID=80864 RepID=UPI001FCAF4CF|nr:hypothetical protein [Delftia lacustris]BDE73494.1 hypothetical protein HQS1_46180 [Delftia lacustris]
MPRYEVRADLAEVEATLREALTPQELATLRIEAAPKAANNPFAPGARRGEPVSTTVLVWIAGAAASGIAYDLMKALTIKVYELLHAKYGASKVKKDESAD